LRFVDRGRPGRHQRRRADFQDLRADPCWKRTDRNRGSTSRSETGLLTDWADEVDRRETLNDAFCGAGNARAQVGQKIDIAAFGSDGLLVKGPCT